MEVKNYNKSMKEINKLLNSAKTVIFLDYEGTQLTQEIIAIGAVKVTLDNKNQIKKVYPGFKQYVKAHGEVGPVVSKLTGITDIDLQENGINFLYANKCFKQYVGNHVNIKYITYGNYDMRLLHQTSVIAGLSDDPFIKSIYKNYIDFSSLLGKYLKSKKGTQLSLHDALDVFNITPKGDAHNPMYDALNLMLLYKAVLNNKAILIKEYTNLLLNNHPYPAPISKIIRDLKTKGSTTMEDFIKYVGDDL